MNMLDQSIVDPIITAIAVYRAEIARYNVLCINGLSNEECDKLADRTFAGPLRALETWDQPARSKPGAMVALELAIEEERESANSEMVLPLIEAALAYLKGKGERRVAS